MAGYRPPRWWHALLKRDGVEKLSIAELSDAKANYKKVANKLLGEGIDKKIIEKNVKVISAILDCQLEIEGIRRRN